MYRKIELYLICLLTINTFSQDLYVQEIAEDHKELTTAMKSLDLNTMIEQGIRKNFEQNKRDHNKEIIENRISDNKESFYLPQIALTLNASSFSTSNSDSTRIPNGSIGLEMKDYSIFNWGKDYLKYLNVKENLERANQINKEETRAFRQDILAKYSEALFLKESVSIKKEQLRNASFIYRLNREKVTQKKISKHEYYQARSEYLRAQQEYFETKLYYQNTHEEIAALIDDQPGTKYLLNQRINHQKIKLTLAGALKLASENSPDIKTAKTNEAIKNREYEIALKDNMPLPNVSLNLGTYKHHFSDTESDTYYRNDNGTGLNVVASVNASWTIFGDGGLFNKRKLANSRLEKENARINNLQSVRSTQMYITKLYHEFSNSHDKIKILEARVPTLKKTMDIALNKYVEAKGRYSDFHLALVEYFEAQIDLEKLKWIYLKNKITLAQIIGVEELPGELFDKMVSSGESK